MGKSAQFPFQPWLAGAMEGPTPVSALLHAATMVAAGVYLLFKVQFLLSPEILTFIAFTGAITALMGAYAAITQNDIKKVLAFSTISQLGYMMVGIGSGSFDAAFFHLVTHAFFKACLFLCAGAVIHSMHKISHHLFDRQQYMEFNTLDMRLMGGFRKKMPVTFIAYTIAALSLIGIPLFSGFLSKDAILINSYHWAASGGSSLHFLVPFAAFITVFITAFYMGRQLFMVFFHKFRLGQIHETSEVIFEHLKENGKVFTIPVITLSFFSLWFIFSINPFSPEDGWFYSAFAKGASQHEPLIPVISVLLGTAGLFAAWSVYGKKPVATGTGKLTESFWFRLSYRNFYLQKVNQNLFVNSVLLVSQKLHDFDQKVLDRSVETVAVIHVIIAHIIAWFDKYIVDGIVTLTTWIAGFIGKQTRSLQVGKIQSYLFFLMLFLLSFLLFIII
jgi:NADH-quinone oxidoreductase subunit L